MKNLIGITAILLGSGNIAHAAITEEPTRYAETVSSATIETTPTNPFTATTTKIKSESLISTLSDYLPNGSGQKKLNASCN